jgi:hypothetical protein
MKKLFSSKKALIFEAFIVIITIMILTTSFILIGNKINEAKKYPLGTNAYTILSSAESASEETFFIEKLLMLVVFCGRFVGGGTGKGAVSTVTCDTVVLGVAVLLVLVLVSVLELAV